MSMDGRYDVEAEITFEHEDPETALYMALGFTHGELHFSPDSYQGWDIRFSEEHNRTLLPSGAILADFAFLNPHYQLGEMAVGRKFWIRRGSVHQGTGHVTQILNLERSARKRVHYDLPVEVTFLQAPINNPSRYYSLLYGKHVNAYDLYQGVLFVSHDTPFVQIKKRQKKHLSIQASLNSAMLHEPINNVYQRLDQQPKWLIHARYDAEQAASHPNNAILARGQHIQLLRTIQGSITVNVIIEAKQDINLKERLKGFLSFTYGTLFEGENYKLNGTEQLLMLEEGQKVNVGQPVRGHLDLHGFAKHIEALPSGTEFVLRADDKTIAKGRVI
ncbi:hypothetical protein ACP8Y2_01360 [Herpetosiphon llansteffanensis]